jgi:tRNA pseudouridine55 synthase
MNFPAVRRIHPGPPAPEDAHDLASPSLSPAAATEEQGADGQPVEESRGAHAQPPRRPKKREIDGWVVLDKPVGMTSTHAVAVVKRVFNAKKAGHAGTLDPLASGVLPIALGEATKTVPFVMDGRKSYRFTVRWGIETDTDDAEGRVIAESETRPSEDAIRAGLAPFTGSIMQTPPKFSAVKIAGERAYDLARAGEEVVIEPRAVEIRRFDLIGMPDADHAEFEAECGKGTYVRALARDLGRALGTHGHVVALRRTAVGAFAAATAVPVADLQASTDPEALAADISILRPVAAGLTGVPAFAVSRADASRLARGQAVLLRGRDAPASTGWLAVTTEGRLVALAESAQGELHPRRIFRLRGHAGVVEN